LSAGPLKQATVSGGTTENPPTVFSHYLDIKRHNKVLQKEAIPPIGGGEVAHTKLLKTIDYQEDTFNLDLLE